MRQLLRPALASFIILTLVTGVAYPFAVTGISMLIFPNQATGSLIDAGNGNRASSLIGQPFSGDRYFWPRPSAASGFAYNPLGSAGSNLAPSNPALHDAVQGRVRTFRSADAPTTQPVPVDLVTASASGLDPHISVAAAEYQVARVAGARNVSQVDLRRLVAAHTERRTLGVLGEPRVNVLVLNLALDRPAVESVSERP